MRIARAGPAVADRSQMWAFDAGRMYLCERGPLDAPPLLLIHGLLVHHYEFVRLLPELGTRRLLAPDLFGSGDSDAPSPEQAQGYSFAWHTQMLIALLDRLGVGCLDVVGHSTGGTIAACLAAALGSRVRRLVLLDTVAYDLNLPLEGRVALFPRVGPALFKNVFRRAELRRYFARVFADPSRIDELAIDLYWDRLARSGHREAAHAMIEHLVDMGELQGHLMSIQAETQVIWGADDSIVPLSDGQRLAAEIPGASIQTIEACGHAPNEERPVELGALIRDFFAPGLDGLGE